MGADEMKAFLSHLATEMNVAASTQKPSFFGALVLISRGAQTATALDRRHRASQSRFIFGATAQKTFVLC